MKQLFLLIFLLSCFGSAIACSKEKPINNKQTFNDCLSLAEQGDVESQLYIGLIYDMGQRVKKDYVLAHMWLNIAASNGNSDARNARFRMDSKMSTEQIQEAQRLAREWIAKHN